MHPEPACLTFTTLKYFCISHGNQKDQMFFSIWNHHKCPSYLFPLHLNTYVMGVRLLSVRRSPLYVTIWRLMSVPALKKKPAITTNTLICHIIYELRMCLALVFRLLYIVCDRCISILRFVQFKCPKRIVKGQLSFQKNVTVWKCDFSCCSWQPSK